MINKGIEFNSQNPRYYYTKLAELKLEMIAEATKDANSRAKNIAINAESEIGDLKHAKMGVFKLLLKILQNLILGEELLIQHLNVKLLQ